ncbi:unnamed protein product [Durusdinium trenchii]|uniref:Uncharacterized protein n=1 Tax=Durusdinium trenchii TaxID=1381693 RepID=A0ABP0QFR7_9DINO
MAPKAAKAKAAKAGAKAGAKAAAKVAASPPPAPPLEKLSVFDAETNLNFIEDEDWAALASAEEGSTQLTVMKAVLLLLGEETWRPEIAREALEKPDQLLKEIKALGPLGASEANLKQAASGLEACDLGALAAKAKAAPGAPAAVALAQLVEAYAAERSGTARTRQRFAMGIETVAFQQLHRNLQQALHARQHVCLVCSCPAATAAAQLYCKLAGCSFFNLQELQVQINLSKSMSTDEARGALSSVLKTSMAQGQRLVLQLGSAVPNLRHFCDATQVEVFDFEKLPRVAEALGVTCESGFQLLLLAELSAARAEKLPQTLPGVDEMATLALDPAVPALDAHADAAPSLRRALRLLAAPAAASGTALGTEAEEESEVPVNTTDFEYLESFSNNWEERWLPGPADQDENGKEIKRGLITAKLVKYPSNPKDAKSCLQLMGGAPNAPCTGLWTSFWPLIRPTEVEFEFTVNGKVDLPNACLVFTERPFEGALPDCKVGVQFTVRGGMQLCGGGGNLVRISNDGKIQNDKWNKVLMKIDWKDKVTVAQVDTRGKGYAPAIQTVPFRDPSCQGFGALFLYNTDTQATCWFSSLRIKQSQEDMVLQDTDALAARRDLADRLKQREYQMAVDADMEVGMKMGAIKSTSCHGMNLAMEQAANNASSHAMG